MINNTEEVIVARIVITKDNKKEYGSGLFCKLRNEEYDLIITCAHCITSINSNCEIEIYLEIKTKSGDVNTLKCEYIEHEVVNNCDIDNAGVPDIGMIVIKKINVNQEIYVDCIFSDKKLEVNILGYPYYLKNENYLKKYKFEGNFKQSYDSENYSFYLVKLNQEIYQTERTEEIQKISGLSGAPAYYEQNGKNYMIGIQRGVLNSTETQSVAYGCVIVLKIEMILRKLVNFGYIIYEIDSQNDKLEITWIHEDRFKSYQEKDILVIGSSGAGKSSFIGTFAKHKAFIQSSGDGQTTRSDIEYNFSIYEENPRVEIKFLKTKEFINKRIKDSLIDITTYVLRLITNTRYKLDQDIEIALKCNMSLLNEIKDDKGTEDRELKKDIDTLLENWYKSYAELASNAEEDMIVSELDNVELLALNFELIDILCKYNNKGSYILTTDEKSELIDILLNCKGFFKLTEFDYLGEKDTLISDTIREQIYRETDEVNLDDLINSLKECLESNIYKEIKQRNHIIYTVYKLIYDKLFEQVRVCYQCKEGNVTIDLNDMNEETKNKLTYVLKVTNESSVTALVSEVKIYDSISNDYAVIMDQLHCKKIRFIDTCGLDHITTGNFSRNSLRKTFEKYNQNIKVVFYVKKLDSGKPTELENILPFIYSEKQNAIVYCIFNGIDIMYQGDYSNRVIEWNSENELPKAVEYIKSPEGEKQINNALNRRRERQSKGRSKILYATLEKNLVPFCSSDEKLKINKLLYNNKFYFKKIMSSIIMEEHLGLEVINKEIIDYISNNIEFKKRLSTLLKQLFKEASLTDWGRSNYWRGHYKTKNANYTKIKSNDMGWEGTHDDRWNYSFLKAYPIAFKAENIRSLFLESGVEELYDQLCLKIESMFIDYIDEFLGCPVGEGQGRKISLFFHSFDKCKDCSAENQCFRKILRSMYNKSSKYRYNIDQEDVKSQELHLYLNDICNFEKGYSDIEEELITYFHEKLVLKFEKENQKNIKNILTINPLIKESYLNLQNEIEKAFKGCYLFEIESLIRLIMDNLQILIKQ